MAFKMKGPSLYSSPLTQKKTKGFGPKAAQGEDDQSKEMAVSKYEMGEYKNDPTGTYKPKASTQDDKKLDRAEDARGVGKGSNRKVMKDGYVNPTQKKKIADEKARFNALTPAQKKAEQDAANAKRKAFENTEAYKKRKADGDAKTKKGIEKNKASQGDFVPAYPGADISKEEYDKRRKAGSTKRD